jgi:hypothetical protein
MSPPLCRVKSLPIPAILPTDEPTSGLDSSTSVALMEVLSNLAQLGATVVAIIRESCSPLVPMPGVCAALIILSTKPSLLALRTVVAIGRESCSPLVPMPGVCVGPSMSFEHHKQVRCSEPSWSSCVSHALAGTCARCPCVPHQVFWCSRTADRPSSTSSARCTQRSPKRGLFLNSKDYNDLLFPRFRPPQTSRGTRSSSGSTT